MLEDNQFYNYTFFEGEPSFQDGIPSGGGAVELGPDTRAFIRGLIDGLAISYQESLATIQEQLRLLIEAFEGDFDPGVPAPPPQEPEIWRLPIGDDLFPSFRWYGSTRHGPNSHYGSNFHTGVDFNLDVAPFGDVDRGEPIFAIADGEVHDAGYSGGRGWLRTVVIKHQHNGSPLYVRYAHLAPVEDEFAPGEPIRRGQLLGHLGNYLGGDTGDHLHFDMNREPFAWNAWCSPPLSNWLDPEEVLPQHIDPEEVRRALARGDQGPSQL